MATEVDLQRLIVSLEASFTKYDRAWSKAMGTTDANVRRVQQRFDGMSRAIDSAGANTSRALSPIAGQTGNIAAQFQDIAVQLQGGQSPFLIAMQQGTQLSSILNQTKSPIAALGAAFVQLVNPISLATIAAIALGGAAAQYLGSILGDGRSATEVVKEQNEAIRRVAERWGEAVPALRAYVDELDRAAERSDLEQAIGVGVAKSFAELRAIVPDLRAELAAARIDIEAVGGTAQEIDALQAAFNTLVRKVEDGTATSADLDAVMAQLATTTGAQTIPTLVGLQEILSGVAAGLAHAARRAAEFNAAITAANSARIRANAQEAFNNRQFVSEQERLNGLTAEQLALENEIARVKSEADREGAVITEQQALELATARLAAEERRAQIASAERSSGRAADRERQAVIDLIAELEHEYSLLGMTEQQKAVSNALRRAGAAATDAERQSITDLVNATYLEREALEATNEQMREFADISRNALQTFLTDVMAGKDATEALGNALNNIGNKLINLGLDSLFGGGSSGGGLFSGIFGGARAAGGPVQSGKTYLVGEKGPELFTPPTSGMIVANDRLGGGGPNITFAPVIDARGADTAAVARIEQVLARQSAEFEGRVKQIVKGRGHKWR